MFSFQMFSLTFIIGLITLSWLSLFSVIAAALFQS